MARKVMRKGRPRRRVMAIVRKEESNCGICGFPIDLRLDPQKHRLGSTVHEIVPISLGGSDLDRNNLCHAHRLCNSKVGNRLITPRRREECRLAVMAYYQSSDIVILRGSRS